MRSMVFRLQFLDAGFLGMMAEAEEEEDAEGHKSLLDWQDWLGSIPGIISESVCPMTGSNIPTITFTHKPTGVFILPPQWQNDDT